MSDTNLQTLLSTLKVALAFVNAFAGILAAYPGPELSGLARVLAAATVAGCGAALLMLTPPGHQSGDDVVTKVSDELERRRAERVEARLRSAGNG